MRRKRRLVIAAATLTLGWVAIEVALRLSPLPVSLDRDDPESIAFLDRNGLPLRTLLVEERKIARRCALAKVSPNLVAATIAAEDQRFWRHHGIDWLALARATRDMVTGKGRSGASTISQQLVKLSGPVGPRDLPRKISEIWTALALETRWSKERILEAYLNRLDYGNLQTGIAAASRYYFDKPPRDLSLAESAFLAGLPRAPTRLDPFENPDRATGRQKWVLNRMEVTGVADGHAIERARRESLKLAEPGREFEAPHFMDLLLKRRGLLPAAGGPLVTTLDLRLNLRIEAILADQLAAIAGKHATSGAVVVIDNPTGEVLALAGSGDYFRPGSGQVNGAWTPRSPGSAIKPFTYLLAIEAGANPCTVVADVPTEFETPTGLYKPNNYSHRFHGPVSLRFALGNSLNIAAIRALQLGGGPEQLHRTLGSVGITTLGHPADYYGLGLTLGNGEVRLLELANAFATIARLGVYRPFRLVKSTDRAAGEQIFDRRAAWLVADMMADNNARVASFGHDSWLAFDFPVACKTGTSSDYRDNLTVGFTPEFTVAVWVGNADGSPMREITGVTGAAPVMHEVMDYLHDRRGTTWFERPEGIAEYWIEPLTGRRVVADSPGALLEKCWMQPEGERTTDRDRSGHVVLGAEYREWLAGPQNSLGSLVKNRMRSQELRIVQPRAGAIYFLDPDVPAQNQRVSLVAEGSGEITWTSDSLDCQDGRIHLSEGVHRITAHDATSGREAGTWIEVKAL